MQHSSPNNICLKRIISYVRRYGSKWGNLYANDATGRKIRAKHFFSESSYYIKNCKANYFEQSSKLEIIFVKVYDDRIYVSLIHTITDFGRLAHLALPSIYFFTLTRKPQLNNEIITFLSN